METTSDNNSVSARQYDLTKTVSQSLDKHLIFPLVEFLGARGVYGEDELLKAKLDLASKTNMADFAADVYKNLYKTTEIPAEMTQRRTQVLNQLKQLQAECLPILQLLENQNLVKQLRADKNFTFAYLEQNHQVTQESVDALYRFAKFQFDCGNYAGAHEYLYQFRALNSNPEKNFSALWGKLASGILTQNWDEAMKDVLHLREFIDSKSLTTPLKQLQQRTWLMHWSLFVFFNHSNGKTGIIDLFFQERYMNAIQTTCPHILRYLTTAVICNKRRRNVLKDLVKVIQQESYTYRDPITEFLEALYVNFDFEGAQVKLRECDQVLQNDFFLVACRDEFMENARLFIFETFCRIHQRIDIGMLAEKLNMDKDAAERWIVNLIRNARLDAKIDSKANQIIMGSQTPSVYQKIIEKTKGLTFRSYMLANNLKGETQGYMEEEDVEENQPTAF
eukprot:TRINITY_DN17816_c0_g1_i1.p1 TRINITY_DN17816_c0_g1~~TRINITY_DN17816_c0_g1_i1.p1  ORF type:complete len:458 (+),score=110.95 TRINITY_DN17816_c0_g1_i1:28-1374(+)